MPVFLFIAKNWKYFVYPLIVIAIIATPYYIGKADGKREYKLKCTARIKGMTDAAQAEADKLEADGAKKAEEYQEEKAKVKIKLVPYERKFTNEKETNPVYADCHAGPEFMRYYEQAAGYNSAAESEAGKTSN